MMNAVVGSSRRRPPTSQEAGHQEVKQPPQLEGAVLDGGAAEDQAVLGPWFGFVAWQGVFECDINARRI
jgi:hypothetical protein